MYKYKPEAKCRESGVGPPWPPDTRSCSISSEIIDKHETWPGNARQQCGADAFVDVVSVTTSIAAQLGPDRIGEVIGFEQSWSESRASLQRSTGKNLVPLSTHHCGFSRSLVDMAQRPPTQRAHKSLQEAGGNEATVANKSQQKLQKGSRPQKLLGTIESQPIESNTIQQRTATETPDSRLSTECPPPLQEMHRGDPWGA